MGRPQPGKVSGLVFDQARLLMCLVMLVTGRRDGVSGDVTSIRYDRALRPIGLVLVGVAVAELVVIEVVLPWATLRLVLLVLGVYTLLWVAGVIAAWVVRPHLLTSGELRLRSGPRGEVTIPLRDVVGVTARVTSTAGSRGAGQGEVLTVGSESTGAVELRLRAPIPLARDLDDPVLPETRIVRFAADDPHAAVKAVQERLAALEMR